MFSTIMPVFRYAAFLMAIFIAESAAGCEFALYPGDEFTFPAREASLQKYSYLPWFETITPVPQALSYEKYVGKRGKLTMDVVQDLPQKDMFQVAILEDCTKIYVRRSSPVGLYSSVIFTRDLATARLLIGRKIWVTNENVTRSQELSTERASVSYPLEQGEELSVIGLALETLGHIRGAGPFYLRVQKATGEIGLIRYNPAYFTFTKPQ